jgi:hypothetical protein
MPEMHTVDFIRGSFNISSSAENATITLQFARDVEGVELIGASLKAIRRRFGAGPIGRLSRWRTGECNPFLLPPRSQPHPHNPDVLCYEMRVKPGQQLESALASLIEFLRHQPGYRRLFGAPLDRDQTPSRARTAAPGDTSEAAHDVLSKILSLSKDESR